MHNILWISSSKSLQTMLWRHIFQRSFPTGRCNTWLDHHHRDCRKHFQQYIFSRVIRSLSIDLFRSICRDLQTKEWIVLHVVIEHLLARRIRNVDSSILARTAPCGVFQFRAVPRSGAQVNKVASQSKGCKWKLWPQSMVKPIFCRLAARVISQITASRSLVLWLKSWVAAKGLKDLLLEHCYILGDCTAHMLLSSMARCNTEQSIQSKYCQYSAAVLWIFMKSMQLHYEILHCKQV